MVFFYNIFNLLNLHKTIKKEMFYSKKGEKVVFLLDYNYSYRYLILLNTQCGDCGINYKFRTYKEENLWVVNKLKI